MKNSPQINRLESILRSSKLVSGGFLGEDSRGVIEIIESDIAEIAGLGYSLEQISMRMKEITEEAIPFLGNWAKIDELRQAKVDEAKGFLVCPWPHPGKYAKRVTELRHLESNKAVKWSDLNIHLIAEHGFFEGKGSVFRINPGELIRVIF